MAALAGRALSRIVVDRIIWGADSGAARLSAGRKLSHHFYPCTFRLDVPVHLRGHGCVRHRGVGLENETGGNRLDLQRADWRQFHLFGTRNGIALG